MLKRWGMAFYTEEQACVKAQKHVQGTESVCNGLILRRDKVKLVIISGDHVRQAVAFGLCSGEGEGTEGFYVEAGHHWLHDILS